MTTETQTTTTQTPYRRPTWETCKLPELAPAGLRDRAAVWNRDAQDCTAAAARHADEAAAIVAAALAGQPVKQVEARRVTLRASALAFALQEMGLVERREELYREADTALLKARQEALAAMEAREREVREGLAKAIDCEVVDEGTLAEALGSDRKYRAAEERFRKSGQWTAPLATEAERARVLALRAWVAAEFGVNLPTE